MSTYLATMSDRTVSTIPAGLTCTSNMAPAAMNRNASPTPINILLHLNIIYAAKNMATAVTNRINSYIAPTLM